MAGELEDDKSAYVVVVGDVGRSPRMCNHALSLAQVRTFQVWSLTQFYSVDFSQSRIGVKSAFSKNAQSRFASAVFDGVLGPPHLARHT